MASGPGPWPAGNVTYAQADGLLAGDLGNDGVIGFSTDETQNQWVATHGALQVDWNNQLNWWYESGNLYANYLLNGVQHALATLRYDPAVHVWWRFRETAGTAYWETSVDGSAWTVQGSTPTAGLFSVQALDTIIHAREFGVGNPNPGTAKFSNINPPP